MIVNNKEFNSRFANFKEVCRKAGVKITNQRIAIFEELARNDIHPSAETIYKKVKENMPAVSLDTVYRTLSSLKELGVITAVESSSNSNRYDARMLSHHHFICSRCGKIHDLDKGILGKIRIPKALDMLGTISKASIEFHGLCKKCLKNRKNKPKH